MPQNPLMTRIPVERFSDLSYEEILRRVSLARSEREYCRMTEAKKPAKKASTKRTTSTKRKSSSDKVAAALKALSQTQLAELKAKGLI